MYVHPAHRLDRAACLAFAQARGFGLIVAYDGARPVGSPLPFDLVFRDDGTPRAQFHVARGNPLAALASRGESWLIAVNGADAYVSPDWYVSPEQVPTWLYETVHLSGRARLAPVNTTRDHLERLTRHFEQPCRRTARMDAGAAHRRPSRTMLQAIVAIDMDVDTVEGSAKLNQPSPTPTSRRSPSSCARRPIRWRGKSRRAWSRCGHTCRMRMPVQDDITMARQQSKIGILGASGYTGSETRAAAAAPSERDNRGADRRPAAPGTRCATCFRSSRRSICRKLVSIEALDLATREVRPDFLRAAARDDAEGHQGSARQGAEDQGRRSVGRLPARDRTRMRNGMATNITRRNCRRRPSTA